MERRVRVRKLTDALDRMQQLALYLEKMRITDYVEYMGNPRRVIFLNLIAGLARGFGMAIGFTILTAVAVLLLRRIVHLNLPLIGGFIAEMVKIVQARLNG